MKVVRLPIKQEELLRFLVGGSHVDADGSLVGPNGNVHGKATIQVALRLCDRGLAQVCGREFWSTVEGEAWVRADMERRLGRKL